MGLRDHAIIIEEAGITLQLTRIHANKFWYKVTIPIGDSNLSVGILDTKGKFHFADTNFARKLKNDIKFTQALTRVRELTMVDKIQLS